MGCGAAINGLELARTWTQTQQMQEVTEKDQVSLHLAIDVPSVHMSFTEDIEVCVVTSQVSFAIVMSSAHCMYMSMDERTYA